MLAARAALSPRPYLVGHSQVWRKVLQQIEQISRVPTPVLIVGETGTGKEEIAKAIHDRSLRAGGPLVAVNCSMLSTDLALSELFGHEKGAFTGAVRRKAGHFEIADGGTLFLDEVGELPPLAQAQLLRVLQDGTFQRVGGDHALRTDVRLVAATHRDLAQLIRQQRFRSDLYFRLNVFPLLLPPLRQRLEDLPLLARHIVERLREKFDAPQLSISDDALETLRYHAWPGNVRELQNALERAAILAGSALIEPVHCEQLRIEPLGEPLPSVQLPAGYHLPLALTRLERAVAAEILRAIAEARGRISGPVGAAALLGVPPSTLNSTIKRLQLRHR